MGAGDDDWAPVFNYDEWQSYVEGLDDSINFDEDEMCDAYPSLAERQDRNSYMDESLNAMAKSYTANLD